jgi:hypothetical protein
VVPIYDAYVCATMPRLVRWEDTNIPFTLPPEGDREYWNYCVRFLRLLDACHEAGTVATVKFPPGRWKRTEARSDPHSFVRHNHTSRQMSGKCRVPRK